MVYLTIVGSNFILAITEVFSVEKLQNSLLKSHYAGDTQGYSA